MVRCNVFMLTQLTGEEVFTFHLIMKIGTMRWFCYSIFSEYSVDVCCRVVVVRLKSGMLGDGARDSESWAGRTVECAPRQPVRDLITL